MKSFVRRYITFRSSCLRQVTDALTRACARLYLLILARSLEINQNGVCYVVTRMMMIFSGTMGKYSIHATSFQLCEQCLAFPRWRINYSTTIYSVQHVFSSSVMSLSLEHSWVQNRLVWLNCKDPIDVLLRSMYIGRVPSEGSLLMVPFLLANFFLESHPKKYDTFLVLYI